MTDEIKVDPKEVRNAAATLKESMTMIRDKQHIFRDIEYEIESAWKSRSTRKYLDALEETERQIEKTVRSVETVISNLTRIAENVERAEKELSQIMTEHGGGGHTF